MGKGIKIKFQNNKSESMFTGIIEALGKLKEKNTEGSNLRLVVEASFTNELKVDQSVAHNGVCLTVEAIEGNTYELVAVKETLSKTNLNSIEVGDLINLERCMKMNARLDGHIVQGHADGLAKVTEIVKEKGSSVFYFQLQEPSKLIVEKGSICINGISLTAFNVKDDAFAVTIIPYTMEHTNFHQLEIDDTVNIEFDIIGKYVARLSEY